MCSVRRHGPSCIYQGASHQGQTRPILLLFCLGFFSLTARFVWMLSQLWKSLRGFYCCAEAPALKRLQCRSARPLAVRRAEQCEGSLFINKTSSGSSATGIRLSQISLLRDPFNLRGGETKGASQGIFNTKSIRHNAIHFCQFFFLANRDQAHKITQKAENSCSAILGAISLNLL